MSDHGWKRTVLVPIYFFVGGLAGGTYVLGAVSPALGKTAFRVPLPLLIVSAAVLTLDLTRPTRFWRLFAVVRATSPLSLGAWTLVLFGPVSLAAFVAPDFRPPWLLVPGTVLALFLASYTGILLTASSRPLWNRTLLLGPAFLASAAATSAAALLLLAPGIETEGLRALLRGALAAHAALLAAHFIATARALGASHPDLRKLLRGALAPEFWTGAIAGVVAPAVLPASLGTAVPAALALAGGLLLRRAVFVAGE